MEVERALEKMFDESIFGLREFGCRLSSLKSASQGPPQKNYGSEVHGLFITDHKATKTFLRFKILVIHNVRVANKCVV